MTERSIEGIYLGDATDTEVTVALDIDAESDEVADAMVIELRDRAYRVAQAMSNEVPPSHPSIDPHPISMNWERKFEPDPEEESGEMEPFPESEGDD